MPANSQAVCMREWDKERILYELSKSIRKVHHIITGALCDSFFSHARICKVSDAAIWKEENYLFPVWLDVCHPELHRAPVRTANSIGPDPVNRYFDRRRRICVSAKPFRIRRYLVRVTFCPYPPRQLSKKRCVLRADRKWVTSHGHSRMLSSKSFWWIGWELQLLRAENKNLLLESMEVHCYRILYKVTHESNP